MLTPQGTPSSPARLPCVTLPAHTSSQAPGTADNYTRKFQDRSLTPKTNMPTLFPERRKRDKRDNTPHVQGTRVFYSQRTSKNYRSPPKQKNTQHEIQLSINTQTPFQSKMPTADAQHQSRQAKVGQQQSLQIGVQPLQFQITRDSFETTKAKMSG